MTRMERVSVRVERVCWSLGQYGPGTHQGRYVGYKATENHAVRS